jgi:hypothetical protein
MFGFTAAADMQNDTDVCMYSITFQRAQPRGREERLRGYNSMRCDISEGRSLNVQGAINGLAHSLSTRSRSPAATRRPSRPSRRPRRA